MKMIDRGEIFHRQTIHRFTAGLKRANDTLVHISLVPVP
jgi:hypothetical protein